MATKDPTTLTWTAAFIEGDGDRSLAQLVSESTLSFGRSRTTRSPSLGATTRTWCPQTVAKLVVPGDLYTAAVEKEGMIGWALAKALDGHLNKWRLELLRDRAAGCGILVPSARRPPLLHLRHYSTG
jgi:hypothetical protein